MTSPLLDAHLFVFPEPEDAALAPHSVEDALAHLDAAPLISTEVSGPTVIVALAWDTAASDDDRRVALGLLCDWAGSCGGRLT